MLHHRILGGARLALAAAATLACLGPLPATHAAAPVAIPVPRLNFQERTLANGLHVITLEDHTTPTAAIHVWYHVGSKNDPAGRSGFAHLFEHLMFKSTKNMPSETIDRLTGDIGGENNAFTADDMTVYHESVPSNHLQRLLWAEASRLSSLNVSEENFHSERAVVQEEYRQRILASPFGEFGQFVEKNSFAEHPYKRPTIGSIPDLEAATIDDVRKFHATFYRPDNATLIVVGDIEPKQVDAWVDQYFAPIKKPEGEIPRVTTQEPARQSPPPIVIYDARVPLPALCVNYLAPAQRATATPALEIAEQILGGGESSRFYQALVYEKQLAQVANFDADLREDLGRLDEVFIVASGKKPDDVLAAAREVEQKILTTPVSDQELQKAKNQIIAGALSERQTNNGKAQTLGEAAVLLGGAERANTDLVALQKVTAGEVQDALKKWITPENRLVLRFLPEAMKPAPAKAEKTEKSEKSAK